MREKTGLSRELVELLFCLFSRGWLQGCTEEGGDVGHGSTLNDLVVLNPPPLTRFVCH